MNDEIDEKKAWLTKQWIICDQSVLDFSFYNEITISNENIRSQPIRLKTPIAKIESQSSR